jgi:molecular chaperone GrpE
LSDHDLDRSPRWWSRLFGPGEHSEAALRLERMERQLAELRGQVEALRSDRDSGAPPDLAALHETLSSLEKQIGRAGREQLKINSIAEAQAAQLTAALEQLRAESARREAELVALREQSRGAQSAARRDKARALLPALDGLDEALRAGQPLLDHARKHVGDAAAAEPNQLRASGGWLGRLLGTAGPVAPAQDTTSRRQLAELREGLDAWLAGLTFVRQRLLDVLAAEDVRPIDATGQPFDPSYHVALGVTPATERRPTGTVAEELRRGYLAGERVLRHAEVVVATAEPQTEEVQEGEIE